ncbi:hypothetical protein Ato02nite_089470 [Paractinoplanes toevensis]|uniref:Deoxyribonuclease NucA/NucB domain-containing protein n=1 Tax=Paractinoplanes toevensis TaxID=571911 RepID=A0A920BQA5_9ACTN|nr:hypothetical protein Ato02nite_089470 [Actinoplanes toevensis]
MSGTATTAGTFTATVTATDTAKAADIASFTWNVATGATPVNPGNQSSPSKVALTLANSASGGATPYTWSASGLPTGLVIDPSTGTISGTPTAAGTVATTVTVTDSKAVGRSISFNWATGVIVTTPATQATAAGKAVSLSSNAAGGTTPYTWSASGLPTGLSINTATGAITGTPTAAGTSTVTITAKDAAVVTGTATFTWNTGPAPVPANPGSLQATIGIATSRTLTATSGTAPYAWSASGLPAGLTINSATGVITGTPTSAGSGTVTVTVTDAKAISGTMSFSTNIAMPVAVTSPGTQVGTTGDAASLALSASGGVTPYTWSASGLPAGLTISTTTGAITGTPTTAGSSTVTVTAVDAGARAASMIFTWTISTNLTVTDPGQQQGTAGRAATLALTGAGGTAPYRWSATALPPGLAVDASTGAVSGTPAQAGSSTVTVTVTDAANRKATMSFVWLVAIPVSLTNPGIQYATTGVALSKTLAVSGGNGTYTWTAGNLPAGLTINPSTGEISGIPATMGTRNVTITAADTAARTATISLDWDVAAPITLTDPGAQSSTADTAATLTLAATGGTSPYSWSASGLPPGMTINTETGVVTGTPSAVAGQTATVTVTDAVARTATIMFTWDVTAAAQQGLLNFAVQRNGNWTGTYGAAQDSDQGAYDSDTILRLAAANGSHEMFDEATASTYHDEDSDSPATETPSSRQIATAGVTASGYPAATGDVPPAEGEDCLDHPDQQVDPGLTLNRTVWCKRTKNTSNYLTIKNDYLGTVYYQGEWVAIGDRKQRQMKVYFRMKPGSVEYRFKEPQDAASAPEQIVSVSPECDVESGTAAQCMVGDPMNHAGLPVTRTWAQWNRDGDWHSWIVWDWEGALTDTDKVLSHWWTFRQKSTGNLTIPVLADTIHFFHVNFRCDSASYFQYSPHACVQMDVIPHLQYKDDQLTGEIQTHIKKAQDYPDETYPKTNNVHKSIPGKWTGSTSSAGLHRIPRKIQVDGVLSANPQVTANRARATDACNNEGKYAGNGLPNRPNRPEYQCDEYPFASTDEGAANPNNDFSVESIQKDQNELAGRLLGTFYNADRILYGKDAFYVQVGECDTCDPWTSDTNDDDLDGLQPLTTPERLVTAENNMWDRRYGGALVGTGLYTARGSDIWRYDLKTKAETMVAAYAFSADSSFRPTVLAAYKSTLILADGDGVYAYGLATGRKELLLPSGVYKTATVSGGHLFIDDGTIYEVDLTSTDWKAVPIADAGFGNGVAADSSYVWWVQIQNGFDDDGEYFSRNVLHRLDRTTHEISVVSTLPDQVTGDTLYAAGNYLYAVGSADRYQNADALFRVNKSTGEVDLVASGLQGIYGIVSDGTYLYVIDGGLSRITTPAK